VGLVGRRGFRDGMLQKNGTLKESQGKEGTRRPWRKNKPKRSVSPLDCKRKSPASRTKGIEAKNVRNLARKPHKDLYQIVLYQIAVVPEGPRNLGGGALEGKYETNQPRIGSTIISEEGSFTGQTHVRLGENCRKEIGAGHSFWKTS